MRFLAISGSLRAASTNTSLLRALAVNHGAHSLDIFERLGDIPIFNPDARELGLPDAVAELSRRLGDADGLILACPEYAHGIPGGLKNALDWLVAGSEAPGKPVMLVHASHRSALSRAQLREVLRTMSLRIFDGQAGAAAVGQDCGRSCRAARRSGPFSGNDRRPCCFRRFHQQAAQHESGAFTLR